MIEKIESPDLEHALMWIRQNGEQEKRIARRAWHKSRKAMWDREGMTRPQFEVQAASAAMQKFHESVKESTRVMKELGTKFEQALGKQLSAKALKDG